MAAKTVRLSFLLASGGQSVKAYAVRAGGYQHLIVAPANSLAEIHAAVLEASIAERVRYLKSVNAEPVEIAEAYVPPDDFEITELIAQRYQTLLILPEALKLLKPEKPKRKYKKRAAKKKLPNAKPLKRTMSAETKAKISAARKQQWANKHQQSLLQAVEQGGLEIPLPAAQPG